MRWEYKPKEVPALGATRIKRKFLFFPKRLNVRHTGPLETRWLEFSSTRQKYISDIYCGDYWIDICWEY